MEDEYGVELAWLPYTLRTVEERTPHFLAQGALFWCGDRIDMLIERIQKPETVEAALGSQHRKPA